MFGHFFKKVNPLVMALVMGMTWVVASVAVNMQAIQADYSGAMPLIKVAVLILNGALLFMGYQYMSRKPGNASRLMTWMTELASYPCCDLDRINRKKMRGHLRAFPIFRYQVASGMKKMLLVPV